MAINNTFGFTRRDIERIKARAEQATDLYSPAALEDLDAPWRVGACMAGTEHRFSGRMIGTWKGRAILVWPK